MRNLIDIVEAEKSPAELLINHIEANGFDGVHIDLEVAAPDEVWLGWVERAFGTEPGAGKKLLDDLCSTADALSVSLSLRVAETEDGDENTRLVQYYRALGFEVVSVEPGQFGGATMERKPH